MLDKTISLNRKPTKILAKANKNKGKVIFKEDSSIYPHKNGLIGISISYKS